MHCIRYLYQAWVGTELVVHRGANDPPCYMYILPDRQTPKHQSTVGSKFVYTHRTLSQPYTFLFPGSSSTDDGSSIVKSWY
jgi:hypothetical protein